MIPNNFNDMIQKLQSMSMQQGNFNGIQGDPNQVFMQNFIANNPQFQQYQNMMNMMKGGVNQITPQNFGFNNVPFGNNFQQQNDCSQAKTSAQPFQQQGIDPAMLFNMMQNRQNQSTAPVNSGAVKRNYFGLSPILSFANKDIIYSLTMYFAKK